MKPFDPEHHHRHTIRLPGYDYSEAGAYYITVCTKDRSYLFGDVVDGEMQLNRFGEIVKSVYGELPTHYPSMSLGSFVVMPNHVHAIIFIEGDNFKPDAIGLPEIVRALKTFSARRCNEVRHTPGEPVWQRNYYEHVIRDEDELNQIHEYIKANQARWAEDEDNLLRQTGRV